MEKCSARDWYRNYIEGKDALNTWEAFENEFRNVFIQSVKGIDYYQPLYSATIARDERPSDFMNRVIRMAREADEVMPEERIIWVLRTRLPRRYADYIARVGSLEQIFVDLLDIESIDVLHNANRWTSSSGSESSDDSRRDCVTPYRNANRYYKRIESRNRIESEVFNSDNRNSDRKDSESEE